MSGKRFGNDNNDNNIIPIAIASALTIASLALATYYFYLNNYSTSSVPSSSSNSLSGGEKKVENDNNNSNKNIKDTKEVPVSEKVPTASTNSAKNEKEKETSSSKAIGLEIPQAKGAEGTNYFKNGDFKKAIELYTDALESTPKEYQAERAVLLNNRAAAYDKVGNQEDSINDCSSVLEIDPLHLKALLRRIRLCSLIVLTSLSSDDNSDDVQSPKIKSYATTALGDLALFCALEIMQGREVPTNTAEQMEKIMKSIGKSEAKAIFKQRKQEQKKDSFPRTTFITSYYYSFSADAARLRSPLALSQIASIKSSIDDIDNEDFADEEDDVDPETAGNRKKIRLMYDLSRVYLSRKEYEECFNILKELAPQLEDTKLNIEKELKSKIYIDYGTFLHLSGNLNEAKSALEAAIAYDPESINAYLKLAGISVELQQMDICRAYFTSAEAIVQKIKQDPELLKQRRCDVADFHFHHGFLHMMGQKFEEAEAEMREAISTVQNFAAAHMQLGVILFRSNKPEESVKFLETACLHSPELPDVHNYYGEVLLSLERYEDAESQFLQANSADFTSPNSYINRALLRLQHVNSMINKSGNNLTENDAHHAEALRTEAFSLFDKASEIDPSCEVVYVHKANDYFQRGDLQNALEHFQKAIDLSKTLSDLEEYSSMRASCRAQMDAASVLTKVKARFQPSQ